MYQVSVEQLLEAIKGSGGVVRTVAKRVGLNRSTVYKRVKSDEILRAAVEAERENMLDNAERHLFRYIQKGEPWAIRYILSRLGRKRGYTTRLEVDADVRHTGAVRVYLPDNGRDATPEIADAENVAG